MLVATSSTVLLLGETGSGKERFAAYIHESSRRRERPMITVNCSAIPHTPDIVRALSRVMVSAQLDRGCDRAELMRDADDASVLVYVEEIYLAG